MKTWIGDFRLESTLILPSELPELKLKLPDGEFSLQNASKQDQPNEALAAQIVLRAPTIAEAEDLANTRIREILDVLSFVTNSTFRISRQRFLMDWTPGTEIREQYAYAHGKFEDRWPELASDFLSTVAEIENLESLKRLRAPLRWFAAGIRAQVAEDQFQHFWFVLELIAEIAKSKTLVTDKCQQCHGDLFCPRCNALSTHRPFPKQAIEGLLAHLNVSVEVQRDLFKIRNGIMHGRTRLEILDDIRIQSPDFDFGDSIDLIWQIAIAAIFNALQMTAHQYERMAFGASDSIASRNFTFKAHMQMGMHGDPNDPQLANVVVPDIRPIRVNDRGEEIDPRTGDRL